MAKSDSEIWMITDSTQVPDLLENCLTHASKVNAIVIRERNWTLKETADFCQSFLSALKTPAKPKLILNWNGRFDPGCLPIQGIHLSHKVALSLLNHSHRWDQCFSSLDWKVGVSLHNQKEWEAVRSLPLQYVILSNVYETSCKPGKSGLGLSGLDQLYKSVQKDCPHIQGYALGGLTLSDSADIRNLGLHGMALRSAFF